MDVVHVETLLEAITKRELYQLTERLNSAGVRHLYFKGTALAYTYYQRPAERRRIDSDMLIETRDRDEVEKILKDLEFYKAGESSEEAYSYQAAYFKDTDWNTIVLDLHWNISNRPVFRNLLSFSEAWQRSVPASKLSPSARVFGPVHSLVIAIVHPLMHHHGEQDPIWIQDQRLICNSLQNEDWRVLVEISRIKGINRIVTKQLEILIREHGVKIPAFVINSLSVQAATEATWIFSRLNKSLRAQKALDFLYSRSAGEAWRLVIATLFPCSNYILKKYGLSDTLFSRMLLPLLYIWRIISGLAR